MAVQTRSLRHLEKPVQIALAQRRALSRDGASHILGRLIDPQPLIGDLPQQPISSPRQEADLADELRPNPMNTGKHEW